MPWRGGLECLLLTYFTSEHTQKKHELGQEERVSPRTHIFVWKGPGAWLLLSPRPAKVPVSYTKGRGRTAQPLGPTLRWTHRAWH